MAGNHPRDDAVLRAAADDVDRLPDWVQAMSAELDLDALCEVVVGRDLEVAFPQYATDGAFVERLRASVRENLHTLQDVLCGRLALGQVRLEHPIAFGLAQAELGIPQAVLQRSYRVGFVAMWDEWVRQLRNRARTADVDVDDALAATTRLADLIFGYQDHVASLVADAHARADEALGQSRARVRQRLVREVLAGDEQSLAPSDQLTIGYEFDADHVALVLPSIAEGAAGQLLIGLRAATGVRQSLLYPLSLAGSAMWLGAPSRWSVPMREQLQAFLADADVVVSVSEPGAGMAGFRRSLAQAQAVEQVRAAWGRGAPRVIHYADVALEVLLMQNRDLARRFVAAELRSLAEPRAEDARLRETLEASFRFGSHVAAAEQLGLHEHTIRNRLHRVEQKLGHSWSERRTETQVALRLHRLLAGEEG
ncbi:MAG TPA: helix-turn-helix domain-containing protein [Mycobacteriales bacterium]|nr:helix-turn-helix domain-containing protein [Mycobacteriales bacterium]